LGCPLASAANSTLRWLFFPVRPDILEAKGEFPGKEYVKWIGEKS